MGRSWLLIALLTTAGLATACEPYAPPCPAIAQATVVSVTVAASYAPEVRSLHLKACQDGACKEGDVELGPGSVSIDQGCDAYGACSATSSPDGTKVGSLMLDVLTESAIDVTATGIARDGTALPVRTLTFRPRANYPFGEQCGRFLDASVILDRDGLRARES
jgi:hypothetical protein